MIAYRSGYKYQLVKNYACATGLYVREPVVTEFVALYPGGRIIIKAGYAWDGPSGPALDTKNFMRGSLVHDALYGLMRDGLLDHAYYREPADQLLRRFCLEDGMLWLRAAWVYRGVRVGAGPSADPHNQRPVLTAP